MSADRTFGGLALAVACLLASCGGGGSSSHADVTPMTPNTTTYPNSIVVGATVPQSLIYSAAAAASQATVANSVASPLLPLGSTPILAEHVDASLPGLREVCVSGRGESTNVVANINLGVNAESAAVLLDTGWHTVDAMSTWSAAVASGGAWLGWENCGVKPEGAPSPSSRLVPTAAGGYAEDVFDGNPGTTFQAVRRNVAPADVAAMLSSAGLLALDDPQRPLQLLLRAYADGAGHVILVETGAPASGAAASARGFIALYVPAP
ncbi:MAG: hypothetical protein M3Z15_08150 [Pseudomonadota bacterium]|nr:hypothetical protein [Pseudomonadota bacterium]